MGSFQKRYAVVLALILVVGVRSVFAWTNNLVNNGSFESGVSGWTLFGQGSGVQYAVTNFASHGSLAMRAANRSQSSHHVTQNITTNLLNSGTGLFYSVEYSVWLASPANTRCTLQLIDDGGTYTIILAEKAITAATGQWVTVRGHRTISWVGTLSSASLRFDIAQPIEQIFPVTVLDNIRLVCDSDRDGLGDDLDAFPNDLDSNTNALPDGWETLFALPDAPSGFDADGDGFSNWEEYWAATDPTNQFVFPGKTANTNATPEARALLNYLWRLPSLPEPKVVIGQVVTTTGYDYTNQFVALANQVGRWPAILGVVYDMILGPIDWPDMNPYCTNHWDIGGLVHVQWNPDNPWNGLFSGNTNNIDFPLLFTPGSAAHSNYISYMDEVADGLRNLGQSGMPVLFRPLNECNSAQNWYQRQAQSNYVALYRWTFDYLAHSQGLNHVLWVYDALSSPHMNIPVTFYYPGDDVVDFLGVNLYDDDWVLPFDLDTLSRDFPKPLAIPESGPETFRQGQFSNRNYIVGITSSFPRACYFAAYNSFPTGVSGKAHFSFIDNVDPQSLFDHPRVVTLEELNWRDHLGPFGSWQGQVFGTNANHVVSAGHGADPDGDGHANLLEFAVGSDALTNSVFPMFPSGGGLTFTRNVIATDVAWVVEGSVDLQQGGWSNLAFRTGAGAWQTSPGVSVNENTGLVSLTESADNTLRVWRLRILGF